METMTEETTYNGWKNYPTWNVSLWLDNDPSTYFSVRDMATQAKGTDVPRVTLADDLETLLREGDPTNAEASPYADIMGWALGQVDWFELADHYLADAE